MLLLVSQMYVSSESWSDAFAPTGRIDHFNLPRALPWAMLFCPFGAYSNAYPSPKEVAKLELPTLPSQ